MCLWFGWSSGVKHPLNFVPLCSCLCCFLFCCLVFNYPTTKEVDGSWNGTTISNASCFTNGMLGVCKFFYTNLSIEYSTMTIIYSYTGDKKIFFFLMFLTASTCSGADVPQ